MEGRMKLSYAPVTQSDPTEKTETQKIEETPKTNENIK